MTMSSHEERVVEMRFENQQFERNAATSLSTLEKLKNSLSFNKNGFKADADANNESLKNLNNAIKSMDMSPLKNGLDVVNAKFSALQVMGVTALSTITNQAVKAGEKLVSKVIDPITNGGKTRALNLENAQFQLSGLGISWEKAKEDVNYAVDGTAYGLDVAAKAASQLASSGVGLGDSMKEALRGISGVAAMTNSSYEEISRIFVGIAGYNKVMGQDLLQISGRGINAAATIAKYLGKTEGEVRDMVSKGQIDFATFAAAMDSAFGEHAKDANKTFTGAMSNMKASLARIGADVWTPGLVNLRDIFNQLREVFNNVHEDIRPALEALVRLNDVLTKKLVGALKTDKIDKFATTFANFSAIIINGIADIVEGKATIGGVLKTIVGGIGTVVSSLSSLLGGLGSSLKKAYEVGIQPFAEAVKSMLSDLVSGMTADKVALGALGGGLIMVLKGFADALESVDKIKSGGLLKLILGDSKNKKKKSKTQLEDLLASTRTALDAFTNGFKAGTLLSMSLAILVLTTSLEKLSEISAPNLGKSLLAMGAMFKLLTKEMDAFVDTVNGKKTAGLIKAAVSMVIVGKAINILSDAIIKMGSNDLGALAKGLGAAAGSLYIMTKSINSMTNAVPLKTSVAVLVLAQSCSKLAEAMKAFSKLSWEEIAKGASAMGVALTEVAGATSILGSKKLSGFSSLLGSIGIAVIVSSLDELATAFEKFGHFDGGTVANGMVAMMTALGEVIAAAGLLGKLGGMSSLFGAGAIKLVISGLDELATAFAEFGRINPSEIANGAVAMGAALTEVAAVAGALGKLGGLSSLIGGEAIKMVVSSLDDLSAAFQKFGSMTGDTIANGMTAMLAALTEVSSAAGLLGKLAGLSGLLGAGAIKIVSTSLEDIASAMLKIGSMSTDQMVNGMVGLGGALTELAAVAGLLGKLTGLSGLIGAESIKIASEELPKLAEAFQSFGSMSWDDIKAGLAAMGGALGELAAGGFLNTFAFLGDLSLSIIAEPLGQLADSVKKWVDVEVPSELGDNLSSLATGVMAFTLDGLGGSAIATLASPLGILADSVKKWKDVTVPEGLPAQLELLSEGVKAFTGGLGTKAIESLAEPFGTLADSVKKWKDVSLPEGLGGTEGQLYNLAIGVGAFFGKGFAVENLAEFAGPFGTLADSVKKWKDVSIPEDLPEKLQKLGIAVSGFFDQLGGALSGEDAKAERASRLANAINTLSKIKIEKGLGDTLSKFGVDISKLAKNLDFEGVDAVKIGLFSDNLKKLAEATGKASATDTSGIDTFVKKVKKLSNVQISGDSLSESASSMSSATTQMITAMQKAISAGKEPAKNAISSVISVMSSTVKTDTRLGEAGKALMVKFKDGITSRKDSIKSAFSSVAANGVRAIRESHASAYTNGEYLGQGLINGIQSKYTEAYNAGFELGKKAVDGEKDGQKSKSPSKLTYQAGIWFGEGLINGIDKMGNSVEKSAYGMGRTATNGLNAAMKKLNNTIDTDINSEPVLTPVVDLSQVKNGVNSINRLISDPLAVEFNNLSALMSRNNQNGPNDDIVRAIRKLGNTIESNPRTVNNINGVTYDDGSNITSAVETLIRAAIVERRI